MQRKTALKIGLSLMAVLLLSQAFMVVASAQWDFPRLDELLFKIKYPYTVSLAAAQACEIDTYVGAIRTIEVDTLAADPYYWTVTAAPGFHMCYIGVNCRDVTPSTSGERVDHHGRTPGFSLYPLNLTAFRYALELIVGCNKTAWINDIYGYINVRLDTNVPPANVFWYNPSIPPYPLDWDQAYAELMAAGFSGTIGGADWLDPKGNPLRYMYVMSPDSAPTSVEITRRHVQSWNAFFSGVEVADPPLPAGCYFEHEPLDFYDEIDIAFYDRDHDMYFLCWGLSRNPDYLWWFFHPDSDYPDWNNSPGLDYRPLNAMIDAFFYNMWTEKTELRIFGPGPMTVPGDSAHYTDYPIASGSEDLWIGVYSGAGTYPYRVAELEYGVDYTYVTAAGLNVGVKLLDDIVLDPDMYIHMVYTLNAQVPINLVAELQSIGFDIQWMLYYMCPYLPIYSRNYHDLYKAGVESWVPSLGYGSAAYQLKWTYGSVHWTGVPVGGSIQWHLPGPVNTFHPYRATSVYEVTILNRMYDAMLSVDAYTHQDIPMCAVKYKIEDWTGPSGEPGMYITYWIRNDLTWQDGDPIDADDFIWDYEFINSIQAPQLFGIWGYYHGYVKHNEYCFSLYVNTTGVWNFYAYTGGPTYPQKIWGPYYGDLAGADAFRPWEVAHPTVPGMTCLYGTGEWILDYYDSILGIIRMYKNVNWWGRLAAQPCRQIPGLHAPTSAGKLGVPKVTKAVVGLYTFNLDTKADCEHNWVLKIDGVPVANGARTLVPLGSVNWWQAIPWQTLTPGLHIFVLETTNIYGTNVYTMEMYVLIGDVDNNNIVNMLDLYKTALVFGQTGPACWKAEDIDNNGVINMLDLYICAVKFGTVV